MRIIHVFRAPLGGLFRHVVDLARAQAERGHDVGLFFDSAASGDNVARGLEGIRGDLTLGVSGVRIERNPDPSDAVALAEFTRLIKRVKPDIVHGHGSKGGLLARAPGLLSSRTGPVRAYTPHGGSFNYRPGALSHRIYMATERLLSRATDVFLFESAYIAGRYDTFVGAPPGLTRVVANGISATEFEAAGTNPDAAEFLYVGELRAAKGIDTLIEAIALAGARLGRAPRAVLVGSGPDRNLLLDQARRLGVENQIAFAGPMPIREAFRLGRVMVVPSRAESMPYVVLEAAAARMPMVASNVGGIPEIFGPYRAQLGPCGDPADLCARMIERLLEPPERRAAAVGDLAAFVAANFSISAMVSAVMVGYRDALERRAARQPMLRAIRAQPEN